MLRRCLAVLGVFLIVFSAAPAQTPTLLDQRFEPGQFREVELRQIQRALLFAGYYNGLLDGEWGQVSARALAEYARDRGAAVPQNRHLAPLLAVAEAAVERLSWQEVYFQPFGALIGFPSALLDQTGDDDDLVAYANGDDSLGIMLGRLGEADTLALHEQVLRSGIADRSPYVVRRDDRMVTSLTHAGHGTGYVRSDRDERGWITVFIYASGNAHITEAALMASAYHFGPDRSWDRQRTPNLAAIRSLAGEDGRIARVDPDAVPGIDLPPAAGVAPGDSFEDIFKNGGGDVARIDPTPVPGGGGGTGGFNNVPDSIGDGRAGPDRRTPDSPRNDGGEGTVIGRRPRDTEPEPYSGRRQNPDRANSTGTGFYISHYQLVTNHHVIEDCRIVTLEDGTPVRVLGSDRRVDLALLEAHDPSAAWLTLADVTGARLGEKVFVLGYPYYGLVSKSLSLTTGVVSSLTGVDDDTNNFTLSAPIQPGNSGGPVLNHAGHVLGVAVARISEEYISDRTGTLPQNINFAIRRGTLGRFLAAHGGAPDPTMHDPVDMERGAPDMVQAAVTPVLCYE